ncbi:hypothetical protein QJS04_geneDACA020278 [Acorus gramineus]|uniref:Uncharacterized protein n=1 Tax=Acorus gramineus TaxID=55184 RepID=A0AAV9ABA2_ACOGR|nr:hypothetical protein QJS04_geneDACA020278 [Acorus gramineus]
MDGGAKAGSKCSDQKEGEGDMVSKNSAEGPVVLMAGVSGQNLNGLGHRDVTRVLCGAEPESVEHLFVNCSVSGQKSATEVCEFVQEKAGFALARTGNPPSVCCKKFWHRSSDCGSCGMSEIRGYDVVTPASASAVLAGRKETGCGPDEFGLWKIEVGFKGKVDRSSSSLGVANWAKEGSGEVGHLNSLAAKSFLLNECSLEIQGDIWLCNFTFEAVEEGEVAVALLKGFPLIWRIESVLRKMMGGGVEAKECSYAGAGKVRACSRSDGRLHEILCGHRERRKWGEFVMLGGDAGRRNDLQEGGA